MNLTAVIKKGEKQYVALCPELDVVSQGYAIEDALKNLKEAAELSIEEMGPKTATVFSLSQFYICNSVIKLR